MKKGILILLISLISHTIYAQDITGHWTGVLHIQNTQLKVVFNVSKVDSGYVSTMDSPNQKAFGVPVTTTTFDHSLLKLDAKNIGINYEGTLIDNTLAGKLHQAGRTFELNLSRDTTTVHHFQEPSKPYPYYTEEINFKNHDGTIFAGTLSMPRKEGNFPVVVLISGSGPQNRDEEILGHKPFLVLADHLTRNGIAVLRYDDRGTAASKGDFATGNTLDFASDTESAVEYLKTRKEIDQHKIGLIGHSEGGVIAPIVASKIKQIKFIVLLAGTGIPGEELLLMQKEAIQKVSGVNEADRLATKKFFSGVYDLIKKSSDPQTLRGELEVYVKNSIKNIPPSEKGNLTDEQFTKILIDQISSKWIQFFIKYDPAIVLEKVKCPVLALNGSNDRQVPPKVNLDAIRTALKKGRNKDATIIELPKLNHLFQESVTGSPDEYSTITQSFSPTALTVITDWILQRTK